MRPVIFLAALIAAAAAGDGVKRIAPPVGTKLSAGERAALTATLDGLVTEFQALPKKGANANAEVLLKAVRYALELGEFYKAGDEGKARLLLGEAGRRIKALRAGEAPWLTARGLVVRGYYSPIDGSAQPFALEVPDDAPATGAAAWIWLHGRGDTSTDLHFLHEHMLKPGQFHPKGTVIVHPFGRFCTGYKNAGEQDVLDVRGLLVREKRIDPERTALAGFSMGGAGAWLLGAHYTDRWAVVHTGAGFVDVRRYRNLNDGEVAKLPPWEVALWGQNDVPVAVRNLLNVPVISYSGEKDKQRASAEIMAEEFQKQGAALTHLIGPGVEHKYETAVRGEVEKLVQESLLRERATPYPLRLSWQGRTLDYARLHWLHVTGLGEHWQEARVDAKMDAVIPGASVVTITTANVTSLRLESQRGENFGGGMAVTIDGQKLDGGGSGKAVLLVKREGVWRIGPDHEGSLRKRPGLQGPIDDAFTAPFLWVVPDKECADAKVQEWVEAEMGYGSGRWRWLMRGDVRTRKASEVTAADIRDYHLILWGDAEANAVTAKVLPQLPVRWDGGGVKVGSRTFEGATMVPVCIYPNPLNPGRYVVLNSGLTFREAHSSTNSLQNPKLPDWAVIDITAAPDDVAAGKTAGAGFFDEAWQVKP